GTASLLLGLYSFSLPHTPPPAAGRRVSVQSIIGVDALKELGSPPFYVFIICSFLICIPLAVYYTYAPIFAKVAVYDLQTTNVVTGALPNPSSLMTLGDMSPPAVRGQGQGFLVCVTYAVGMLIGAWVPGQVYNRLLGAASGLTREQWLSFWLLPAGFAAIVLVLFAALFRPDAAPAREPVAAA